MLFFEKSHAIINGTSQKSKDRPWVVKIEKRGKHWCSGSIIGDRWIITAAHCFGTSFNKDVFSVLGGGTGQRKTLQNLPKIEDVILHEGYPADHSKDLALIKLVSPVIFSDVLKPISLKASIDMPFGYFNDPRVNVPKVDITGWGHISPYLEEPIELTSINHMVLRTDEFKRSEIPQFFKDNPEFLNPGHLTVISKIKKTCSGDSGTGWTMLIDGSYYLIGVHTGGNRCGDTSIAADLSYELNWVKKHIK